MYPLYADHKTLGVALVLTGIGLIAWAASTGRKPVILSAVWPDLDTLASRAANQQGMLWLIDNEIDRRGWESDG